MPCFLREFMCSKIIKPAPISSNNIDKTTIIVIINIMIIQLHLLFSLIQSMEQAIRGTFTPIVQPIAHTLKQPR